jgi:acyl carrier protein
MSDISVIEQRLKDFILTEFLKGQDAGDLTPATPLLTTGILDSIATLKLILHLESEFSISIEPHEAVPDRLDTIEQIARLVQSKS